MSRDSHKKCPKNAEKGRKIPELVPNFIRSVHYFNRLLKAGRRSCAVSCGASARASGAAEAVEGRDSVQSEKEQRASSGSSAVLAA